MSVTLGKIPLPELAESRQNRTSALPRTLTLQTRNFLVAGAARDFVTFICAVFVVNAIGFAKFVFNLGHDFLVEMVGMDVGGGKLALLVADLDVFGLVRVLLIIRVLGPAGSFESVYHFRLTALSVLGGKPFHHARVPSIVIILRRLGIFARFGSAVGLLVLIVEKAFRVLDFVVHFVRPVVAKSNESGRPFFVDPSRFVEQIIAKYVQPSQSVSRMSGRHLAVDLDNRFR